ncbi:MAG: cytochrome c [Zhongshania sp.]|jgi:cytochrome c
MLFRPILLPFGRGISCLSLAGVLSLFSLPLFAIDAPAKEVTCRACHGASGAAPIMNSYPKLNGQNKAYLTQSLKAYKAGQRSGGMAAVMVSQATMLSDQEIDQLAEYYASQ